MDYNIRYLNSIGLHVVKTSGDMSGQNFVTMAKELLQHREWVQNMNVLFDHRDLSFEDASIEDLEAIRSFHKENEIKIGSRKSAILAKPGLACA